MTDLQVQARLKMEGLNLRHLVENGCARRQARARTMFREGVVLSYVGPGLSNARVPSAGEPGVTYRVSISPLDHRGQYRWSCTCEDACQGLPAVGACKHARLVALHCLEDLRNEISSEERTAC